MSGVDSFTEAPSRIWWDQNTGSSYITREYGDVEYVRADLAHRRASQAAPAPSDGLREAAQRAVDEWAEHLEDGDPVPTWVAPLAAALAQEGEPRHG